MKVFFLLSIFCIAASLSLSLAQSELHLAAVQNDSLRVAQLLDAGADVNGTIEGGNTPLMVAAKFGRTAICRILLDKGAKVNQANNDGNSALMIAVTAGQIKTVQFLLIRKANLLAKNRDGMDARELAELLGYEDILKLLI